VFLQDPTACPQPQPHPQPPIHAHPRRNDSHELPHTRSKTVLGVRAVAGIELVSVPPSSTVSERTSDHRAWTTFVARMLLRKEVIQPHLPVRLPCYDFVPIADPTFDSSLPYGLGHRLRVLPTFVT